MNRRKGTGSLTTYAGTTYDYSTTPAQGGKILEEHINKIIAPLKQINFSALADQTTGDLAKAMTTIDAALTVYEAAPTKEKDTTHSCKTSCSGLCTTGCYSNCTSCTGCSGCTSCSGCSGTCAGCTSCWYSCNWGCDGCSGCGGGCANSCTAACAWGGTNC